jgi:indolepyruvate decarboxylase
MNTSKTVIQYVLCRLQEIGISDVFGVPGDYSFPVNDAICNDPNMRWIGCCNELNAAYAADGYARIRGMAALCTTYGVGELSAINGIAGSYAEHLPIFHLVGTPNMGIQAARAIMHHTLGNGEYGLFQKMSEPVVCAMAVMTPQNVAMETERLIAAALYHRRPVYMAFPADYANQLVLCSASPVPAPVSDPQSLKAAVDTIVDAIAVSDRPCFLPGILLARTGTQKIMEKVIDRSGLPFATMFMGKSVLDEQHPGYIGMYDGRLMNENVRAYVENCDVIIEAGTMMSDFNSGAFTAKIDPSKIISIQHHRTLVFGKAFPNIEIKDILSCLAERLPYREIKKIPVCSLGAVKGKATDPITTETLYPRWADFIQEDDILIAETGTASMGLGFAKMPKGSTFHNQTLWGSIGWATPASFGAAVAAPDRRVVLVTGDGSFQLTAQEISQFGRLGLKPVVFILNNAGYLIERLLCKDPDIAYNDIASWRYSKLPHALGCSDWFTARVSTCEAFDRALEAAANSDTGCLIEVVTDAYAASPLALKLHDAVKTLYKV